MKKFVSILTAAALTLSISVGASAEQINKPVSSATVLAAKAAAKSVTFSKQTGTYVGATYLSLSAPSGAKIYYTTNGTAPTTSSTLYTKPILINKTTTVTAIYVKSGKSSSAKSIKLTIKTPAPSATLESGIYSEPQTVEFAAVSGAVIYYTTDGTLPTTSSLKYTEPICLDASCTITAMAKKSGCVESDIISESYVVTTKAPDETADFDSDNSAAINEDDWEEYWTDYWDAYWTDWFDRWDGYYYPTDTTPNEPIIPAEPTTTDTDSDDIIKTSVFSWNDGTNSWTWEIDIPTNLYNYAVSHPNYAFDGVNYDYEKYATDTTDDEFILSLVEELKKTADREGYSEDQLLRMVVTFVQNITYVSDYASKGKLEYPKYPVETLFDGCGDCEDSAVLMASMFKALGYDVCLIEFTDHMAVGIAGDFSGTYFLYGGKQYYFVETTDVGWQIGDYSVSYPYANILPI